MSRNHVGGVCVGLSVAWVAASGQEATSQLQLAGAALSYQSAQSQQSQAELTTIAEQPAAGDSSEDKSGTDPTKFLRSARVTNEYAATTNDDYVNTLAFSYVQPFASQTMNLRLKVPVLATDIDGGDGAQWGIGDVSLRYNWLADITKSYGLLVGAELVADSASEDVMGRGKWIVSPLVTYAMFLNKNMIFAPTYQHNFSFAGDEDRKDVNETVLDFYFVYTADDKMSWITIDPALVIDWEGDEDTPFSVEVQFGRRLGTLWGGAFNGYIQPGVGIGNDRVYDWNIEIGVNVTGF
jgi:hypothetical protein